jgi:hypothetical protein
LLSSLGYPQVPILVTPNPVVYLSEAQINECIDRLLRPLVASFEISNERGTNGENR